MNYIVRFIVEKLNLRFIIKLYHRININFNIVAKIENYYIKIEKLLY